MGDSDDEYDRRRVRDKFRGERSEYEQRRPRGDYRDRRDWGERRGRDSWSGGRDQGWDRKRGGQYYGRARRDSEGGDGQVSPPLKRNRRDWDSSYDKGFNSGGMSQSGAMWSGGRGPLMQQHQSGDSNKQGLSDASSDMKSSQASKMMSFKSFLAAQEDNIDEVESVRRYQEYKTEFKRTQLSDFFVLHKDEEWFKNRYHPVDAKNHDKEKRQAVQKRLQVFLDIQESGLLDSLYLENQHSDLIMKLLDTVAIRLEGGSAGDLTVLEEKKDHVEGVDGQSAANANANAKEDPGPAVEQPISPSSVPMPPVAPTSTDTKEEEETEKQKESKDASPDGGGESGSESSGGLSDSEPAPPGEEGDKAAKIDATPFESQSKKEDETESEQPDDVESDPGPPGVDDSRSGNVDGAEGKSLSEEKTTESEQNASSEDVSAKEKAEARTSKSKGKSEKKSTKRDWERKKGTGLGAFVSTMLGEGNEDSDSDSESESEEDEEENEETEKANVPENKVAEEKHVEGDGEKTGEEGPEQRQLHKTLSLFMRSVPPNISKADIAAVCKRFPGYLRVALADPSPERNFYRRGWVTFDNSVNIKDVCWNLSNIRIKDCELNPVVNRDLSKRIRPISGVTMARQVICLDLDFSAQLVKALDEKIALFCKEASDDEKDESVMEVEEPIIEENGGVADKAESKTEPKVTGLTALTGFTLPDENPLLASLPTVNDATELDNDEEQAGNEEEGEVKTKEVDFKRDGVLTKALDKLILYLRVVHSIDYYNGSDYPHEDEMPNRCGILHVRGEKPERAASAEVTDWHTNFKQKMKHYLENSDERLEDEDVQKLGKKDAEKEVENFIDANTVEMAKDKWICPLSGKKFRAKEFVVKHIHNKHSDKLKAVELEVEFFNNYLADPKRPHFPDSTPSKSGANSAQHSHPQQAVGPAMGWSPRGPVIMYGGPRAPFTPPNFGGFPGGPDAFNRAGSTYPPKSTWRSGPRDSRKIVQYNDLDAPEDMDFF